MSLNKEKLKIGIIGFGRMGQLYGKEINNHPVWDLVYVCDHNAEMRNAATKQFPKAIVVADEDIIFADPEIAAVGLFTLADSRPCQIRKAIQSGKHILAEKPVADNSQTEWEIVKEVEESGLLVAVNLFNRNAWYHKTIIDFIRSGEIGDLAIVRIAHQTPGHMPQEGHNPEGPAFH
ncbi:MAG: Gfo/Idh/MocA family oxidoreductase, partial [Dysgonamonadaceae bacterium]|nr:Gfo/Idh/MocA family oxidoreductase [Dysgonamonadaceae bacterium]